MSSNSGADKVKLGELCEKIGSGVTPRGGEGVYKDHGVTLIRSQNVYDFSFAEQGLVFIDDEQATKMKNVELVSGDVLLNITGDSVARCCVVPDRILPARVNQHVAIIRTKKEIMDSKYLLYWINNLSTKELLLSLSSTGATRKALTKGMIENLEIIPPILPEQKAIAATLSCLDDKIELNNRMNKNLEEMAQAIFKSWFVDFEPFQDGEFEESELGMIPKGWRVGTIDELIENTIGGDWGKETEQGNYSEEVVCIRGADIPEIAVGKRGKPPIRFILKKNLEKKQLFKDQIIIEISGGSPTQSTGRTALITDELLEAYKNPLICTNFCRALSFKKKEFSTFVYSLIQYLYKKDILFLYENGTTGIKNLDTGNLFGKHQIIIPDEITFKEYYELYHTLLKSIYDNGIQADKLSTIRDTLLPKLMSGEIRVPIEEVQ